MWLWLWWVVDVIDCFWFEYGYWVDGDNNLIGRFLLVFIRIYRFWLNLLINGNVTDILLLLLLLILFNYLVSILLSITLLFIFVFVFIFIFVFVFVLAYVYNICPIIRYILG